MHVRWHPWVEVGRNVTMNAANASWSRPASRDRERQIIAGAYREKVPYVGGIGNSLILLLRLFRGGSVDVRRCSIPATIVIHEARDIRTFVSVLVPCPGPPPTSTRVPTDFLVLRPRP